MGISWGHEVPCAQERHKVTICPVDVPGKEVQAVISLQPQKRSKWNSKPCEETPEGLQEDDEEGEEDTDQRTGAATGRAQAEDEESSNILERHRQSWLVLTSPVEGGRWKVEVGRLSALKVHV